MSSNDYRTQIFELPVDTFMLQCLCECSGGETNEIKVVLEAIKQ